MKPKTIQEVSKEGSELYGAAEVAIADVMGKLQALGALHMDAYQAGHQTGFGAMLARDRLLAIAGEVAALHSRVLLSHAQDTEALKAAGGSPLGDYRELPPLLVPRPKSGGPR